MRLISWSMIPLLLLCASSPVARLEAQEPVSPSADSAAVRRAALDYIEGWYTGDSARMRRAVHPALAKRIVISRRGSPSRVEAMTSDELVDATARAFGTRVPADRRVADVRILALDDDMASVRLLSAEFVDYMHLARVDGDWRILNVLWNFRPELRRRASRPAAPRTSAAAADSSRSRPTPP